MAKFIIKAPCFIKQIGQSEPEYVAASPQAPATIALADGVQPPKGAVAYGDPVPALKPAHAGLQVDAAQPAHEFAKGSRKGRAADM